MKSTLELFTAENGEYAWRRKARGGRIIEGPVETYSQKATMMRILKTSVFCGWEFDDDEARLFTDRNGAHEMKIIDLTRKEGRK